MNYVRAPCSRNVPHFKKNWFLNKNWKTDFIKPGKWSWPEERSVFVVLLACLHDFSCVFVLFPRRTIEKGYLAAVRFFPCFVLFWFDLVMATLVFFISPPNFCVMTTYCMPFYTTACLFWLLVLFGLNVYTYILRHLFSVLLLCCVVCFACCCCPPILLILILHAT